MSGKALVGLLHRLDGELVGVEALLRVSPSSRAVASAITTLPRSTARLKIVLGCPCAVTAGPDGFP